MRQHFNKAQHTLLRRSEQLAQKMSSYFDMTRHADGTAVSPISFGIAMAPTLGFEYAVLQMAQRYNMFNLHSPEHILATTGFLVLLIGNFIGTIKIVNPFVHAFRNVQRYLREARAVGLKSSEVRRGLYRTATGLFDLARKGQLYKGLKKSNTLIAYLNSDGADAYLKNAALSDKAVQFHGDTSQIFRQQVRQAWLEIPKEFRDFLVDKEFRLSAAQIGTPVLPNEKKPIWEPVSYDQRIYLNHSEGVYFPELKQALITEYLLSHTVDQESGGTPMIRNILDHKWMRSENRGHAVKHEVGHALSALFGLPGGQRLSECASFREAYEKDIAAMGGREVVEGRYDYYARDDEAAGREETFAELWAISMSHKMPPKMASDWSHSYKWIQQFNREFMADHAKPEIATKSGAPAPRIADWKPIPLVAG